MKFYIALFILFLIPAYAGMQTIFVYKKCTICQGRGITVCRDCSGTGKIKVHSSFSQDKSYRIEKCEKCDGTGYTEKCYYCSGTGKIKTDSITY